jgi:hypothetical protein
VGATIRKAKKPQQAITYIKKPSRENLRDKIRGEPTISPAFIILPRHEDDFH